MTQVALVASLLTLLTSGLLAGTYFTWSNAVMPGLDATVPRVAIASMRSMNNAILNRAFLGSFIITPVLGLVAAVASLLAGLNAAAGLMFAASAVYLLGGIGITAAINVPMNNALNAATIPDDETAAAKLWNDFSARWTRWNSIRGLLCAASMCLAGLSLYTFDVP